MRGRLPKPAELRILEGNREHRPIPTPPAPSWVPPRCPAWLGPAARREWRRVAPELRRMRLLFAVDRASLASYCVAVAELEEASSVLRQEGRTFITPNGFIQARPEVAMVHRAQVIIRAFAAEFGFSPSARTRLGTFDAGDDNADGILSS